MSSVSDEPTRAPPPAPPPLAPAAHARGYAYAWAHAQLARLPLDTASATRARNRALIETLGNPALAAGLVREVLGDPAALAAIAARSYRHTNHFDKIVLVDGGAHLGYRLTLHLWSPPYTADELADEQIHDHRFSFWSKVLLGEVVFQDYARDATGEAYTEYQYIPEKLGTATVGNYYIDVGAAPLREVGRSGGRAGASYYLPFSRIHRVALPTEALTATLVLRGPRQKNYASVFSARRKYAPSANHMFTPDELAGRLARVLHGLEEVLR